MQALFYSRRRRFLQARREGGRARTFWGGLRPLYLFHLYFYRSLWAAGGASASLPSGTALVVCIQAVREGGRAGICFSASALVFSHLYFLHCVGRTRGASASLLSAAALVVCIQAGQEGGRAGFCFCASALGFFHLHFSRSVGEAGVASAFLLSATALVVCIPVGREGGCAVFFVCYGPCSFPFAFLPLCRGMGVQELLYFRRRRLWPAYKRDGRAGVWFFLCASALVFFPFAYIRSLCRAGGASAFLLSAAALVVCIQAVREDGRAFFFGILPPLYFSIRISPGVCGGQGVQALIYSRRRRLWFAYRWDGRAGACFFLCASALVFFHLHTSGVCVG